MLYDHALFARARAGENALRPGLTVQRATDVIRTIGSPEVYQRLVRWRGWTRQQYEDRIARLAGHAVWMTDTGATHRSPRVRAR